MVRFTRKSQYFIILCLFVFHGALCAQVSKTNPSLKDSDGDGYYDGPDTWVSVDQGGIVYRILRSGEDKNGDGKYQPKGVDGIYGTGDDETDPNNPSSYPQEPTILRIGIDTDQDGLFDEVEEEIGTDPLDRDTDDDGLLDGDEYYGTGKCYVDGWHYGPDPLYPDTDGDGIPDGTELGVYGENPVGIVVAPILGTNLSATFSFLDYDDQVRDIPCYIPDTDQGSLSTLMDPQQPDTNFDGIIDGYQDKNKNGAYEPDGQDMTPGNDDDESDAVVGARAVKNKIYTFNEASRFLYIPDYDENDPYIYDPPPKTVRINYFWGSSSVLSRNWVGADSSKVKITPSPMSRPDADTHMTTFAVSAGPTLQVGEKSTFSLQSEGGGGGEGGEGEDGNTEQDTNTFEYERSKTYTLPITALKSVKFIAPNKVQGLPGNAITVVGPLEPNGFYPNSKEIVEMTIDYVFGLYGGIRSITNKSEEDLRIGLGIDVANEVKFRTVNDYMKENLNVTFAVHIQLDEMKQDLELGKYTTYGVPFVASDFWVNKIEFDGVIIGSEDEIPKLDDWWGTDGFQWQDVEKLENVITPRLQDIYNDVRNSVLSARLSGTLELAKSAPPYYEPRDYGLDIYVVPYILPGKQAFVHTTGIPNKFTEVANANLYLSWTSLFEHMDIAAVYYDIKYEDFHPRIRPVRQDLLDVATIMKHEVVHYLGGWFHTLYDPSSPNNSHGIPMKMYVLDDALPAFDVLEARKMSAEQNEESCLAKKPPISYFQNKIEANYLMSPAPNYYGIPDTENCRVRGSRFRLFQNLSKEEVRFIRDDPPLKAPPPPPGEDAKSYLQLLVEKLAPLMNQYQEQSDE